jgi:hypothetical protein
MALDDVSTALDGQDISGAISTCHLPCVAYLSSIFEDVPVRRRFRHCVEPALFNTHISADSHCQIAAAKCRPRTRMRRSCVDVPLLQQTRAVFYIIASRGGCVLYINGTRLERKTFLTGSNYFFVKEIEDFEITDETADHQIMLACCSRIASEFDLLHRFFPLS